VMAARRGRRRSGAGSFSMAAISNVAKYEGNHL
jgi:hypothetical protein